MGKRFGYFLRLFYYDLRYFSDSFPTWSPDGTLIVFSRDVGGNVEIFRINLDGTDLQQLTNTPGPDTLPVYMPDGQLIFRSVRGGSWGIWKMTGQGSNPIQVIPNAGVGPDWSLSRMGVK